MKAVILATAEPSLALPLAKSCPSAILPVLNRPFLEHTIRFLAGLGLEEIALVFRAQENQIPHHLGNGAEMGVRLRYVPEERPGGTGGSLRPLVDFLQGDIFLVISGSTFLWGRDISRDISQAIALHRERGAVATVLMNPQEKGPILETVEDMPSGKVQELHIIYPETDRRKLLRFTGMFICNPKLLQFIPPEDYFDMVEQLLPTLYLRGDHVRIHPVHENGRRVVESVQDYYWLNHGLLADPMFSASPNVLDRHYTRTADNLWIGKKVKIAPTAYVLGPVVIGDNCEVRSHAQIIGPAVLGPETVVGERALLRESITWKGVTLEAGSRASYCVFESSCVLKKGEEAQRRVVTKEPLTVGDMNLVSLPGDEFESVSFLPAVSPPLLKRWLFQAAKRAIDLIGSALGILICLPLFAGVSIGIKMTSEGPVFFTQRRCGRGGKEFGMIKFRTMVVDAHKMQKALQAKKAVDGPMFKFHNDPRVTPLGRFLRMTSLDEFPQLFNVLKGDMSFVGPRPLASTEMRFHSTWREARLRVKPGITGLWQVNGRSRSRFHDWIRYDIEYVTRQSLTLDMKILAKTAKAVIKMTGAY